MARTLSANGAALIAGHEGKVNHLYDDPAGHCTIGIGHLVHRGNCNGSEPAEFRRGLSDQEVYDLFIADAGRFIDAVNDLITVPLSQNQFDALVSFAFNVGIGALDGSTLRQKLNRGDYAGAVQEFGKWVKADGRTLPGLVRRREDEARLFLTPDADDAEPRPRPGRQATTGWEEIDSYLQQEGVAINVPPEGWQTTGGAHASTSWHYKGMARDYSAGMGCDERAVVNALRPFAGPGGPIVELFHAPTGTWLKNGVYLNVGGHTDHVHAAIRPGASLPVTDVPVPPPTEEPEMAISHIIVHPGEQVSIPLVQQGTRFGVSMVSVTLTSGPESASVRAVIGPDWHGLDPDHPEDLVIPPEGRRFEDLGPGSNVLQVTNNTEANQSVGVLVEAK